MEIADFGNTSVPELPEAAVRSGFAYQAEIEEQATGRHKIVLGGHTTSELVSAWMKSAKERGLTDIYGVPTRGFAGGGIFQKSNSNDYERAGTRFGLGLRSEANMVCCF